MTTYIAKCKSAPIAKVPLPKFSATAGPGMHKITLSPLEESQNSSVAGNSAKLSLNLLQIAVNSSSDYIASPLYLHSNDWKSAQIHTGYSTNMQRLIKSGIFRSTFDLSAREEYCVAIKAIQSIE